MAMPQLISRPRAGVRSQPFFLNPRIIVSITSGAGGKAVITTIASNRFAESGTIALSGPAATVYGATVTAMTILDDLSFLTDVDYVSDAGGGADSPA